MILPIAPARESWRVSRGYLGRHRGVLTLAALAFAVVGLAQLGGPWLMGRTVDAVLDDSGGSGPSTIARYAVGIAVAGLLVGLATWAAESLLARAVQPALAALREDVVDRALHLDHGVVEDAGVGDVVSRVGDDVRAISRSLELVVPTVVGSAIAVLFTVAGLVALDWRLGLAGLVAGPAYWLSLRWYLPRSGPYYQRERVAQGERAEALVTGFQGAATLRAYGLQDRQVGRIRDASWAAVQITLDVFGLLMRFGARNNRAELVGLLAVLGTGFLLVRSEAATVGEVTAAALFFHRLFNPIGALIFLFDEVQSAGASLTRLVGVVLVPRAAEPAETALEPGPLTVRGLSHSYVADHPVVRDVDLTVAPGERVALVGASGAGKTTLGAVAAGVLDPTRGEVRVSGTPLAEIGRTRLRRCVALVSQEVHDFSATLRDAVLLADPGADDEQVRAALETVLAWGWVAALPDGLDTVVGEHGHALTPTQSQQVALARVALLDPWFVVLDEATAEAGSAGARELETAALAVTEGRGALVIAHRLSQAVVADRVLVMDDGRIVEQGTHEELVAAGGRYADLWSAWSG
ncbi:ABC transporter ATP-binding protein [Nocardioides dongxiaopingii]|uniref:ABC transporter ATP-binding protein n=1 Tax=Nocardioides sp. S-1144 TaxID=2582905 RepID=UPI001162876B|nr:ABC transporter ATP-binding protein [Nocardioides sp. S-1144]QDH10844.1 ABC transporter ATP-binding protein [Nocardioides sp. S-1144]